MDLGNNSRNENSRRVLREIWKQDGISRKEISTGIHLDKSTITKITSRLIKDGLIVTAQMGQPGPLGGRRPVGLSIVGEKGYFLGIELKTDECFGLLVDSRGDLVREVSAPYSGKDFDSALETVVAMADALSKELPLKAVGIGLPGIVNHTEGLFIKSFPLNIKEPVSVCEKLGSRLPMPVLIENDANCGCWSELISDRTRNIANMIYLSGYLDRQMTIHHSYRGSGIGAGLLINGRVLHGKGYSAGEFRSIFVEDEKSGQFAHKDTDERLKELARNMAMLINTFNIDELILGGGFHLYGPELLETFAANANLNWVYEGDADCLYRYSRHKERDVAYGAAAMCLDRYFGV